MENVNVYAFADEASSKFDEQVLALKRNGLQGIEIRGVDGENVSEISFEKAKEVKQKLDSEGLVTWSIGSPIGKIDIETGDFQKEIEVCKHVIEVANILDCKNVRMFSFFMPKGKNPADYKNEVIDRLGKMTEIATASNMLFCHENEKGIYGDVASRCHEILTMVPDLVGVFDPANFVQSDQETMAAWEILKPYIKYMHIKDALANGSVVPAGSGAGNVAHIVKEFVAMGGKDFTIEPHLAVFDGLKNLEEGIEKKEFVYSDSNAAFDVACKAFYSL